jgi:hypothetical protein
MLSCTLLNTKQQNDINEANNFKIQHTFSTYFMLSNSGYMYAIFVYQM